MANKKQEDLGVEILIWRLILAFVGLIVAVIFILDRKEIMNSYRELRSQNPFLAWIVKCAFIILMIITLSTIGTIVGIIIHSIQQN